LLSSAFRGALAENYIKQTLQANGVPSFYWRSGNSAEVDFLITDAAMNTVPIEVKSADNVRSRSLTEYRNRYHPTLSIRISTLNFGYVDGLRSIPLYAASCVT
jgi:predicted AAA+ superfamily ATPase